jgi:hypothetical protein
MFPNRYKNVIHLWAKEWIPLPFFLFLNNGHHKNKKHIIGNKVKK